MKIEYVKFPVCIIGNKSDTGGKHTLRYASLPYDTSNVTLYTMSLKHETCVQYDNTDLFEMEIFIQTFSI